MAREAIYQLPSQLPDLSSTVLGSYCCSYTVAVPNAASGGGGRLMGWLFCYGSQQGWRSQPLASSSCCSSCPSSHIAPLLFQCIAEQVDGLACSWLGYSCQWCMGSSLRCSTTHAVRTSCNWSMGLLAGQVAVREQWLSQATRSMLLLMGEQGVLALSSPLLLLLYSSPPTAQLL